MKRAVLLSLCLLPFLCAAQEWVCVAESLSGDVYEVDYGSIRVQDNLVYVWTKHTPTPENAKKYIKEQIDLLQLYDYKNGMPADVILRWLDYEHTIAQEVYDCVNNKRARLSYIDYSDIGEVLYSYDFDGMLKMTACVPGSIGDAKLQAIKKYVSSRLEYVIYEIDGRKARVRPESEWKFLLQYPDAKLLSRKKKYEQFNVE